MQQPAKLGHFRLEEEIGAGGMGTVYKAFDESLQRHVAIKLLHEQFAKDPKFVEDFLREARNAAAISHPHIVHVHYVGEEAGQFFVVMELLNGRTLREILETDGPLDEERALQITAEVAEALGAAYHNNQLIHGDIKPANIFITGDAGAKVLDFGLAKLADVEAPAAGEVWGSPYYMSPERVGRKAEDFRSDIYSLGATLFHVLTGRPPFDADTPEELAVKRLHDRAPGISELKPELTLTTEQVVAKMLSKSPLTRYRDYSHLLEQLNEAKTGATAKRLGIKLGSSDPYPQPPEPVAAEPSGTPRWIWIVLIGVIGAAVGIGGAILLRQHLQRTTQPPAGTKKITQPEPSPGEIVGPTAQELERLSKKRDDEIRREAARQEQLRSEADAQLMETAEQYVKLLVWRHDFSVAVNKYKELLPQLQTDKAKMNANARLLRLERLAGFKAQLMADIAARAYELGKMVTRANSPLIGRLTGASDTELTFATEYGELNTPWADVAPKSLVAVAQYYAATRLPTDSEDVRKNRMKLISAFEDEPVLWSAGPKP
jgi:serine/threonine protein kinase